MAFNRQTDIAQVLRQRIERAIQAGAIGAGDRLPSTREVATELDADPRVVMAAYRRLAEEGLVEMRARSGVFVASRAPGADRRAARDPLASKQDWVVDLLVDGVMRGVPGPEMPALLARSIAAREVRTAVIATSDDQTLGMCRALKEDFGLACQPVRAADMESAVARMAKYKEDALPTAIRRAQLLITTDKHGPWVTRLAHQLGKRVVVASVRPDLVSDEWLLLMGGPVFVVAQDQRFLRLLRAYLRESPQAAALEANVHMLVAGRDDLSVIAVDAPTYVTEAARHLLGRTHIPGRLIPTARFFAKDCVRAILEQVVELNASRS